MNKKGLINELQNFLSFEYTDIFIYNNEADLFEKKLKTPQNLSKIYKSFALDELTHADIISRYLLELKVKPVWEYKEITVFASIKESLKRHLDREIKIYQSYMSLIEELEDRRWSIILKGIAESEKQHIERIIDIIQDLEI